ncbi:MAG: ATP-dependent DNA helicase RecG, partial [Melioribacteraceae bacterium]
KDELAVRSNQFNFNFDFLSPEQIEKNKTVIRLNSMVKYASGFDLSEIDMKLRGPGNIFGTQQSGLPELKYANIIEDSKILFDARDNAFKIIASDPLLTHPDNSLIKKTLQENYSRHIHLAQIA